VKAVTSILLIAVPTAACILLLSCAGATKAGPVTGAKPLATEGAAGMRDADSGATILAADALAAATPIVSMDSGDSALPSLPDADGSIAKQIQGHAPQVAVTGEPIGDFAHDGTALVLIGITNKGKEPVGVVIDSTQSWVIGSSVRTLDAQPDIWTTGGEIGTDRSPFQPGTTVCIPSTELMVVKPGHTAWRREKVDMGTGPVDRAVEATLEVEILTSTIGSQCGPGFVIKSEARVRYPARSAKAVGSPKR
jgi:hypothetical protein